VGFEPIRQTVKYILWTGGKYASLPYEGKSHVRNSPFTIDNQSLVLLEQNPPFASSKINGVQRGKSSRPIGTVR
jgi:hypothetical protein